MLNNLTFNERATLRTHDQNMSKVALRVKTRRYHFWLILAISITLVSIASNLAASEELIKSLVGTWECTVAIKQSSAGLRIQSVTRQSDQWMAKGRAFQFVRFARLA